MPRQLFGTDGIRGVAGEPPLDPRTVYAAGAALGEWARGHSSQPQVLIGMDTRESGPGIAEYLAGGLASRQVRVRFAGVITTPGVAHLTRTESFVAGVMISASHNPYQDNGIKVFAHSGFKLPDEEEHRLEEIIFRLREQAAEKARLTLVVEEGLDARYIDYLASTIQTPLEGCRIVVDCGHGAACRLAPPLFERLGAKVESIGCAPDGHNINLEFGALHPEQMRRRVLDSHADLGVAFDGDADRAIFVSGSGRPVDGDCVMLISARHLLAAKRLTGNGAPVVVATAMSNFGLEKALRAAGIRLLRAPVGDKYVLEEMQRTGAVLGGEQSGHVIYSEYATTGDGLLTALRVLEIMRLSGKSLDQLTAGLEVLPQLLVNVRVQSKRPLSELPGVRDAIRNVEESLGDNGRVLVRFSGTEPLARVMVEGPDPAVVEIFANRIADAIRQELAV